MSDVGTTPRKYLTPVQRLRLFERFAGVCQLCGQPIRAGFKWRVEHLRPLSLGGGNELDNLAPVHEACADDKNKDDWTRAAKAKRSKMASLGIKGPRQKIQSRGFAKKTRTHEARASLPPRRLFTENDE